MPSLYERFRDAIDLAAKRDALRQDYRHVFGTPAGQRVLADLLGRTGVMRSAYRPRQADVTAFNEGQRRMGLYLIERINDDPAAAERLAQSGQTEELFA